MPSQKRIGLAGAALALGVMACGPLGTGTVAPAVATEPPALPTPAPTIPEATAEPTPLPTPAPSPGEVRGLLWKDRCLLSGGEAGEPLVLGQGCVSTGPNPWEWGADQVFQPGFEPEA